MVNYNRKIDVIIPAYNVADDILFRCLSSIACQDIIDDVEVTIVDDASTCENYEEIANDFKRYLKINILRYELNGGPGIARQYGIDHTSNEYMTFVDADDTLNGSYTLRALRNALEFDANNVIVVSNFEEEILGDEELSLLLHKHDWSWMFGKMYRRCFIETHDIRFHPTSRANEDSGFNQSVKFFLSDCEKSVYIDAVTYYWHYSQIRITSVNNNEYEFTSSTRGGFHGYVENMIFCVNEAKWKGIDLQLINSYSFIFMVQIYIMWVRCYQFANEHAENNLKWAKWYYDEVYKDIESLIDEELYHYHYSQTMNTAYENGKFDYFMPCVSYREFLDKLR